MTDRNPDINVGVEDVPSGCYIHEGKSLQRYARAAKIPFGVASEPVERRSEKSGLYRRPRTIGLVIRISDRERMEAALSKTSQQ